MSDIFNHDEHITFELTLVLNLNQRNKYKCYVKTFRSMYACLKNDSKTYFYLQYSWQKGGPIFAHIRQKCL